MLAQVGGVVGHSTMIVTIDCKAVFVDRCGMLNVKLPSVDNIAAASFSAIS